MSVLIKGMEMPKRCSDCELEEHDEYELTHECRLIYKGYTNNFRMFERHKNCPLVALPDKHGRLGDLDELWERMLKYTDNEGAKMPYGDDDSLIHRDSVCFMIENAPTIIEAE